MHTYICLISFQKFLRKISFVKTHQGDSLDYILNNFPITEIEYKKLDKEFGDLAHFAAWQLYRNNKRNNQINSVEDIAQDLRFAVIKAGSYMKRQRYIESCLQQLREYVPLDIIKKIDHLDNLWHNRTRHGANKQKFGAPEENELDELVKNYVPEPKRISKKIELELTPKIVIYCKSVIWNCQKNLGRRISKGKDIYNHMVSLSENDHLI